MTYLANLKMKNPEQISDILLPYRGKKLRVGFSGGADSTALLLLLLKWGWHPELLEAVHFEHGLRGCESTEDAIWCRDFCVKRNIPFTMVELKLAERSGLKGSIEDIARNERLAWYRRNCDDSPIVLAHHAGDAVENLLLKLARGGNAGSLTSLRKVRKLWDLTILRPLLDWEKCDLEEFLRSSGITDWRIDRTNSENCYHRNFIRNFLLKEWADYHPPVIDGIARSCQVLAVDADFIEQSARSRIEALRTGKSMPLRTSAEFWRELHPALLARVLRSYLAEVTAQLDITLTQTQINNFIGALPQAGSGEKKLLTLSRDWVFALQNGYISFVVAGNILPAPCSWFWRRQKSIDYGSWHLTAELCSKIWELDLPGVWFFDADKVPDELILDFRRGGEVMSVWHSDVPRRVKHLLSGCNDKNNMLLLKDRQENIYALGDLRRSALAAVTEKSANCLKIVIERKFAL